MYHKLFKLFSVKYLELGGSNDIADLRPEPADPRPGFHKKDTVENRLHDEVCRGAVSLQDPTSPDRHQLAGGLRGSHTEPWPGCSHSDTRESPKHSHCRLAKRPRHSRHFAHLTNLTRQESGTNHADSPRCSLPDHRPIQVGPSKAKGLDPKTADLSGQGSWTWTVGASATPGTWSNSIPASLDGQSKSLSMPFVVQ